ncbi:bifunctional hydroxymethylpyrimidine kinase/phosphomethylpyrimidine kinase [Thermospira aquatica]|uniref:hydroxymethylpyrimidine kinase n=1 Tax=Thermospira aquatica TaxID=2828656 RepID=A0AAX3BF80_9SPIR|nr:bifunctional hydroxymethylpyrimidine kinase/phosphomethylpyrimidine kinase [Thermospira aquatica]URA10925.1 bifunctional hydroxymethylpyrimidine kinase/phosphomethylpyrimidine kinase [Thermospira aquatica]
MNQPVMTIAGSDPSGGAGIQADLKTFTTLGVYGAAVITALTAQNTQGVFGSIVVDPAFIALQIQRVLEDIPIRFIKTGMLANAEVITTVADNLPQDTFLVCDPVMYAKSGYPLLEKEAITTLKEELISRARVLTPNYPELAELLGDVFIPENAEESGKRLFQAYPNLQALVVKGGHRSPVGNQVEDILLWREGTTIHTKKVYHPYIKTQNTHGTGCTLASAITAYLARHENLENALVKAIDYVAFLIQKTQQETYGKGHGPLPHHRFSEKEAL